MEIFRPISDSVYSGEPAQERRQLWLWPNLLSLDAPLLAVLWLNLFAVSAQFAVTPTATLTLALVVWAIYIADRLLDSLRHDASSAARHQFCRQHRAAFAVTLALLLAAIGWLLGDLQAHALRAGLVMIAVVAAYFAAVHFWRWRCCQRKSLSRCSSLRARRCRSGLTENPTM